MGMTKYDRLLHILNLLRTRRHLNARALAEECGVTERSIYRDILALSEANVPIYFDNGYKLASDNFLPPLNLTLAEFRFLKEAIQSTPLVQAGQYERMADSLMAKIEAGLSERVRKDSRITPTVTHVDVESHTNPRKAEQYLQVVEQAAHDYRTVELTYNSSSSGVSTRRVDPYFVVFKGRAFYFVGYCHLREDFRTFRVDRIVDIALTDDHFVKKQDIRPETYFGEGWSLDGGRVVTVRVRFTGIAAKIVSTGQYFDNAEIAWIDETSLMYTVQVNGLTEIQRWLLGFGAEAEVLEPAELRERIRGTVDQLGALYRKGGEGST